MKSIRRQLTRELLIVSLLLLGTIWSTLFFTARSELIEQFDQVLHAQALTVSNLLKSENGQISLETPERLPSSFGAKKPSAWFQISALDGTLIAASDSLLGQSLTNRLVAGKKRAHWDLILPNGSPGRALAMIITVSETNAPQASVPGHDDAVIVLAGDREELDETLSDLLAIAVASGGLLIAAALGIVPRVLRRGLAPLDTLGRRVAAIDAGSLSHRFITDDLPAELHPVATRLNDLLARLEHSFERERRVSADLAHELRTPIAELRTLAESALKWPDARDPAMDQDALAIALHMESLIGLMLALARGEDRQLELTRTPIDLSLAMADAWRPFARRADERSLRTCFSTTSFTITTDSALLRSILNNLYDNAVDYTPAGGEIALTCTEIPPKRFRFTIANPTEHLNSQDIERLFERFWRKEGARTSGQHVGLGLSIVRTFATALGWQVTAALDATQVLTITLEGPTLATPQA
jgi:signal transduction histidine kinase